MSETASFGSWGRTSEEILKTQYPIHRACRDGDVEKLMSLLSDSDTGDDNAELEDCFYGWTAAHWAAYFGKLACLRRLISRLGNHGDLFTSRFLQTPAHLASFSGHPHCLHWLLQLGANNEQKDYLGETPLHKAARTGGMECVSLLIAQGSSPHIKNYNGQTPAELATTCGFLHCAKFLEYASHEPRTQNHLTPVSTFGTQNPLTPVSTFGGHPNGNSDSVIHNHIRYRNSVISSDPTMDTDMVPDSGEDVLCSGDVCRNHRAIAGRKRTREDEADECWKKLKKGEPECCICKEITARCNSVVCSYAAVLSVSVEPLQLSPGIEPMTRDDTTNWMFF